MFVLPPLPLELIALILDHLLDSEMRLASQLATLSKSLNPYIDAHIYRNVVLGRDQARYFIRTLLSGIKPGSFFRSKVKSICFIHEPKIDLEDLAFIFSACSEMRSLSFCLPSWKLFCINDALQHGGPFLIRICCSLSNFDFDRTGSNYHIAKYLTHVDITAHLLFPDEFRHLAAFRRTTHLAIWLAKISHLLHIQPTLPASLEVCITFLSDATDIVDMWFKNKDIAGRFVYHSARSDPLHIKLDADYAISTSWHSAPSIPDAFMEAWARPDGGSTVWEAAERIVELQKTLKAT
ncbi:hypothetical protein BT96DRAFT_990434 [Gymnopus androsaceus JB14]|uniref:F-box domain-containing protein n=1 Tax=Gymnopus androsaceus JB14 TaxID=1447944 RepID=A0A6A4HV99_9AGAR|nr:hypothetical protein BT96DRAFT_990434 [Gymnopus androsaceus JB14]